MNLFYHHVGKEGAAEDFPKTVYGEVPVSEILANIPASLREEYPQLVDTLNREEKWNVWGVPRGANRVISNLTAGDYVVLFGALSSLESNLIGCPVRCVLPGDLPELSTKLWGSPGYSRIFLFKAEQLDLNWPTFRDRVGFSENYNPRGQFLSVMNERVSEYGGVYSFIGDLRRSSNLYIDDEGLEGFGATEGKRQSRESYLFSRNRALVQKAFQLYGYRCAACEQTYEDKYSKGLKSCFECHHLNPLSESQDEVVTRIEDVRILCANCHKVVHSQRPAMSMEELKELIAESKINK